MKKTMILAVLLAIALSSSLAGAFTTGGFSNPYGVTVDERTNFIFVSNVGGSQNGKDDNGFISRLHGDGSIDKLRFIDGGAKAIELNAPKGMAVVGNTLYVTDLDKLRAFDTTYGNRLFDVNFGNLPVQHFYDVKLGPDGALYVADGPGNRIYRVDIPKQHEVTTLTRGETLGQPHAVVWYTAKQVYAVAGWSSGQVTGYNRAGKTRPLPAIFLRTLEGMDADEKGNLYVASTGLGSIYRIDTNFAIHSFNTGIDSPSGIVFHKAGNQIITASFNGGTVESMPVFGAHPKPFRPVQEVKAPALVPKPEKAKPEEAKPEGKKPAEKKPEGKKPEEAKPKGG